MQGAFWSMVCHLDTRINPISAANKLVLNLEVQRLMADMAKHRYRQTRAECPFLDVDSS